MNIRHTIIHTFTVSQEELKIIIKALRESQHIESRDLADEIQKHVEKSAREIQRRFQTQHTVLFQDGGK
jgi:DNA-directed RNA polymerase delta subunit